MAYSISCADTGAECSGQFTTETKEEVIEHGKMHLAVGHPGVEMSEDEMVGLVKVT